MRMGNKRTSGVIRALDRLEEWIIPVAFTVMIVLLALQVGARYVFSFSFSWAEQLARIAFVWLAFGGISLAARRQLHLRVSALSDALPETARRLLRLVTDLLTVAFAAYVAYQIWIIMVVQMQRRQVFPAIPWLPTWVMYLAGGLGMAGLALRTLGGALASWNAKAEPSNVEPSHEAAVADLPGERVQS